MGRIGTILIAVLLAFGAEAAAGSNPRISADLGDGMTAVLDRDYEIWITAVPRDGDAWTRLSLRLTGDASRWKALAELNQMGPNLLRGVRVRVPFDLLREELRERAVIALFPRDRRVDGGWIHEVGGGSEIEGEPLWKIAQWFTGQGQRYAQIRDANPNLGLSTRVGDAVLIPEPLLTAGFRKSKPVPQKMAVRNAPVPVRAEAAATPALATPAVAAEKPVVAALPVAPSDNGADELSYTASGNRQFAVYRLKKGEALWSSVVVRFTGRVFAKDVNEAVDLIVAENRIADVSKLHVGAPIRIPIDLLMPEYLPTTDSRRVAYERSVAESTRAGRRVGARNLEGVHVILDPGHGGRDVGTVHDDLWESTHVYDVAVHLKSIIESRSSAKVWMTTRSREAGFKAAKTDRLRNRTDHAVLTTPNYDLEDAVVGVNLRWYLSNAIYRRLIDDGVAPEKIVFISIHADSLHPSLRGAMAYIPGNRFVTGTYQKRGEVYLARAEVREAPMVEQSEEEALRAEGLSRDLARSIMGAFEKGGLPVHPYKPVRDNIVREGREWVPAVIRYNKVPARLLLEICNLGNEEDRKLVSSAAHRKAMAEAIHAGIVDFYATRDRDPLREPIVQTAVAAE